LDDLVASPTGGILLPGGGIGEPHTIFIHLGAPAGHDNCSETSSVFIIRPTAQRYAILVIITWLFVIFDPDVKITVVRAVCLLRALDCHVVAQALQTLDQSPTRVCRLSPVKTVGPGIAVGLLTLDHGIRHDHD
jgi:hypothetical protein